MGISHGDDAMPACDSVCSYGAREPALNVFRDIEPCQRVATSVGQHHCPIDLVVCGRRSGPSCRCRDDLTGAGRSGHATRSVRDAHDTGRPLQKPVEKVDHGAIEKIDDR